MREPTSHERRAGRPWDDSYTAGPPPWDIGAPQPAFARLASEGAFAGDVLDAGCGTGEHALLAASLGLNVLGVDVAGTAIAMAKEKAKQRGVDAEFVVGDALRLDALGRTFDTVLDCGLLHTFDGDERRAYGASLASVIRAGGTLHVLGFCPAGPAGSGPHPISEADLRGAFANGWRMASLTEDLIKTTFATEGRPAWLARVERVSG